MATTTTTQTTQQTQTSAPGTSHGMGGQTTGASGHTPAEVLNQLNIALCCAHPRGGGGGGGGGKAVAEEVDHLLASLHP